MRFTRDKYIITISDTVINLIKGYKQLKKHQPESGGVLLGEIVGNEIFILRSSIPSKFDKSNRYNFERNKDIAQVIVDYEFYNSNNKTIYIGEWHTHPENVPTPSNQDIKMIKEQYHKNKINEKVLVLLIQGITETYLSIYDGKNLIEK